MKYDETAVAMIALLKYGTGVPFNRLERLEQQLGMPIYATTQWELMEAGATDVCRADEVESTLTSVLRSLPMTQTAVA